MASLILSAALILFWHVYQRSRTSRRHILRDLWQGVGLCDCGGCLGTSKIRRAGCQEGQLELRHMWKFLSTGGTSFSSRKRQLHFKLFQLIECGHPNCPGQLPLLKVNFNGSWIFYLVPGDYSLAKWTCQKDNYSPLFVYLAHTHNSINHT